MIAPKKVPWEGSRISRKTEAVKEEEYPEIWAEKVVEYIEIKISS